MDGQTDWWMDGKTHAWTHERMDRWMDAWVLCFNQWGAAVFKATEWICFVVVVLAQTHFSIKLSSFESFLIKLKKNILKTNYQDRVFAFVFSDSCLAFVFILSSSSGFVSTSLISLRFSLLLILFRLLKLQFLFSLWHFWVSLFHFQLQLLGVFVLLWFFRLLSVTIVLFSSPRLRLNLLTWLIFISTSIPLSQMISMFFVSLYCKNLFSSSKSGLSDGLVLLCGCN